jgi:hypothetical protein
MARRSTLAGKSSPGETSMKHRIAILTLALGLLASASASAVTIGYRPRTGDIWIDTHLTEINRYGRTDTDYFIDDVVSSFGAPRYFVRDLLTTRRWEPADVYYACALAHQLDRPCMDVVRDYGDDRGQGWGVIAQRMGIKPGSAEFHALKGTLNKSDDRYRAHFPGKGNARPATHSGNSGKHAEHGPPSDKGKDHGEHGPPSDKGGKGQGKGKDKGHGH